MVLQAIVMMMMMVMMMMDRTSHWFDVWPYKTGLPW